MRQKPVQIKDQQLLEKCWFYNRKFLGFSRPKEKIEKCQINNPTNQIYQPCSIFYFLSIIPCKGQSKLTETLEFVGFHNKNNFFINSFTIKAKTVENKIENITETRHQISDCFYETKMFTTIRGELYEASFSSCRALRKEKIYLKKINPDHSTEDTPSYEIETKVLNLKEENDLHFNFNRLIEEKFFYFYETEGAFEKIEGCKFCLYKTSNLKKLLRHLNVLHGENSYKSEELNEKLSNPEIKKLRRENENSVFIKITTSSKKTKLKILKPENFNKIERRKPKSSNSRRIFREKGKETENFNYSQFFMNKNSGYYLQIRDRYKMREILDTTYNTIDQMVKWNYLYGKFEKEGILRVVEKYIKTEENFEEILGIIYQKGLINEKEICEMLKRIRK